MSHFSVIVVGENVGEQVKKCSTRVDWWIAGGRWRGFFQIKPTTGVWQGAADVARVGSVDFDAMRRVATDAAERDWYLFREVAAKCEPLKTFPTFSDCLSATAAVDAYWAQPGIAALRADERTTMMVFDLDDYLGDRQAFVETRVTEMTTPRALVRDGAWHWGAVRDRDWSLRVTELLSGLSPETLLTIVDCHTL